MFGWAGRLGNHQRLTEVGFKSRCRSGQQQICGAPFRESHIDKLGSACSSDPSKHHRVQENSSTTAPHSSNDMQQGEFFRCLAPARCSMLLAGSYSVHLAHLWTFPEKCLMGSNRCVSFLPPASVLGDACSVCCSFCTWKQLLFAQCFRAASCTSSCEPAGLPRACWWPSLPVCLAHLVLQELTCRQRHVRPAGSAVMFTNHESSCALTALHAHVQGTMTSLAWAPTTQWATPSGTSWAPTRA